MAIALLIYLSSKIPSVRCMQSNSGLGSFVIRYRAIKMLARCFGSVLTLLSLFQLAAAVERPNAPESSIPMFRYHVERRDWTRAQYGIRYDPYLASSVLMENWRSIGSDNSASGQRARFELVDFLFRFGDEHALKNQELRDDYFRLCKTLEVATDRMAVTVEGLTLFDYFLKGRNQYSQQRNQEVWLQRLFSDCIKQMKARPNDNTVFVILKEIVRNGYVKYRLLNYDELMDACSTDESRVKLVSFISRLGNCDLPFDSAQSAKLRTLVQDSLPLFSCDDERAAIVGEFYSLRGSSDSRDWENIEWLQAGQDELQRLYPNSRNVRGALAMRLRWIATHRGIKAVEKSLESDATFPRLSPDQQFDLWLDLMKQLQVEDERKKLGSRLWHQYPEKAQRIKLLETAIEYYQYTDFTVVRKKLCDARYLLLDPHERLKGNATAPEIASLAMSESQWNKALQVWRQWQPDDLWCLNWNVYPYETQLTRVATCQLRLQRYRDAVETICSGLQPGTPASRIGSNSLPFLLFHLYERAKQLDDLKQMVTQWEEDGITIRSHTLLSEPLRDNLPKFDLPELRDWGVWQMFLIRDLSAKGDLERLAAICKASRNSPFSYSKAPNPIRGREAERDLPLEDTLQFEAARQIAMHGEQGLEHVKLEHSRIMNDPEEWNRLKDWLLYSVLLNKDPKAKKWILELGEKAMSIEGFDCRLSLLGALSNIGPEGLAILNRMANLSDPRNPHAEPAVSNEYTRNVRNYLESPTKVYTSDYGWLSPPIGSLPKRISLEPAAKEEP